MATKKRSGPSFSVSEQDGSLISRIIDRAEKAGITEPDFRQDHEMDLTACHANGCPLDLEAMLTWPHDFDLAHDIHGIERHIDRDTGVLRDFFLPRFAR